MSKKGVKIPMKSGAEFDALTSARKFYCYLQKSGVAKKIKRGYNKRFRSKGKEEMRDESRYLNKDHSLTIEQRKAIEDIERKLEK